MRVTNDGDGGGPWEDFVRLQADFQARLAEETLRYLRRLQAQVGPVVPGTVVVPDPDASLSADGQPGGSVELAVEIANAQQVHCIVTPAVSPFLHASGATWFPAVEPEPATALVAPGDSADLRVRVALPEELPPGEWHGSLLLHGFRGTGIAATISVGAAAASPADDQAVEQAVEQDIEQGAEQDAEEGVEQDDQHVGGRPQHVRRGAASRGPVRPRVPHPTPARGRSQQVVLPAMPPDLAARLEES